MPTAAPGPQPLRAVPTLLPQHRPLRPRMCRLPAAARVLVSTVGTPHPLYNTNDTGAGAGERGGSSQRPPGLLISIIIGVRALHKTIAFV